MLYEDDTIRYNRFMNLDNAEWKVIDHLLRSQSKYAEYFWKMLKYDTPDCLSKENLTLDEKKSLIFTGNGESTNYRLFMGPFVDDTFNEQCSQLHIYIGNVYAKNHLKATLEIRFQIICHNKIINIVGDASDYNPDTNPVELDGCCILFKDRATQMLKCILAELNGRLVNEIGVLLCQSYNNSAIASYKVWNQNKYSGFEASMIVEASGTSVTPSVGY